MKKRDSMLSNDHACIPVTLAIAVVSVMIHSKWLLVTYFSVSVSGSVTVYAMVGPLKFFPAIELSIAYPSVNVDMLLSTNQRIPSSPGALLIDSFMFPTRFEVVLLPFLLCCSFLHTHRIVMPCSRMCQRFYSCHQRSSELLATIRVMDYMLLLLEFQLLHQNLHLIDY